MSGEQFHFVFPQPESSLDALFFGRERDSFVRVLRSWQAWPRPLVSLTGPPRSGVTAVLRAWAREVGGLYLTPEEVCSRDADELPELLTAPLALDDVERITPGSKLLTLLNLAAEHNVVVLVGGHGAPALWQSSPPDLVSRLTAATSLVLPELDDRAFERRLRAACLRRFIDLPVETLKFVSPRLDRSYHAIEAFADELNAVMGSEKKPASVPVARKVLAMLEEDGEHDGQSDED